MEDNTHGRISTTWHSGTNTAPYLAHGKSYPRLMKFDHPAVVVFPASVLVGIINLSSIRHGILTVEIPTVQQYPVGTALGNTGAAKQSPAPHSPVGDAPSNYINGDSNVPSTDQLSINAC